MRVMVAGALGQRPDRGGHAWLFLEYLLGLQELGCDVCFVDRLEPGMCHDGAGRPCAPSESVEAAHVASVMEWAGLGDRWAVLVDGGHHSLGMERGRLGAWASGADLLIDVMGYLQAPDLLAAPARRLFLDIDPGFPQWWAAQGLHDAFGRHDVYATFGTNLGRPGCAVPDTGISWTPTLPPVVLSQWPVSAAVDRGITTVGSWRGPFAPLEVDGRRFGLRAHAMRPIAGLPESCAGFGVDFSIALDVDPA
ncbi:MAG TPA: hypothetical protein VE991_08040, partial [Acidimicrobiales bacterium]|nr:hypothetical protein [Acidimicrobiales bacterium]